MSAYFRVGHYPLGIKFHVVFQGVEFGTMGNIYEGVGQLFLKVMTPHMQETYFSLRSKDLVNFK